MPWNNDNDGPKNPWGGNNTPDRERPWNSGTGNNNHGGGRNLPPPDFDALLKRMQENFRNIMPGNLGMGHAVLISIVAAVGLWLASGFYFIQPNENAVVLTFGKYAHTEEVSGLKYALPWPVQQVMKVDVTTERRIEIGFNSGSATSFRNQSNQDTLNESLMLTGDENIIDIDFVVMWRVGDARQYLFEIRNPEDTVKLVAESAMREVIGQSKITAALTEARGQIQTDTKALMQKTLDEYQSGVTINNIQLLKVDPPAPVIDAFNDVQRARAEAERAQNEAQAYRNDILPRARGESQKTLEDSEAYRQEVIARAKGDADRFNAVYASYAKSKDVTTERMYLETIEGIMQNAKVILLEQGKGTNGVMPYLPLDQLKRQNTGTNNTSSQTSMPPAPGDAR